MQNSVNEVIGHFQLKATSGPLRLGGMQGKWFDQLMP
jgi:hypothetical protein